MEATLPVASLQNDVGGSILIFSYASSTASAYMCICICIYTHIQTNVYVIYSCSSLALIPYQFIHPNATTFYKEEKKEKQVQISFVSLLPT
jgi:hypothetical protein